MEPQIFTVTSAKLAELLGIPGKVFDVWTINYTESIEITYVPADSDLVL